MTARGDVGADIIERIASRLECGLHHITFWRRGLTWYPGGLTQHVWVEESAPSAPNDSWRVHIRTWCLKRVVASSTEMVAAIAAELPLNSVSALLRKPGSPSRLGLGATLWLASDRVDWTSRLASALARLQAYDAVRMANARPVLECGAAADVTERLGSDGSAPAPRIVDPHVAPAAAIEALPFDEIADTIRAHDGVRAIATHSGITASFPWVFESDQQNFILLEMRVATRPPFGPGVWISLSLPTAAPAHLLHALTLNEAEIAAASPTDLTGGWVVRSQALMHESFLPWTLCTGPVIRYLAESSARRAAWLRLTGPSILPGEWPDEVSARILPFRRSS